MNIYKEAIQVQDACNLSGVVHSFVEVIAKVREEAKEKGEGTDYINTHPACRLFADKIASLTLASNDSKVFEAYNECKEKGE